MLRGKATNEPYMGVLDHHRNFERGSAAVAALGEAAGRLS